MSFLGTGLALSFSTGSPVWTIGSFIGLFLACKLNGRQLSRGSCRPSCTAANQAFCQYFYTFPTGRGRAAPGSTLGYRYKTTSPQEQFSHQYKVHRAKCQIRYNPQYGAHRQAHGRGSTRPKAGPGYRARRVDEVFYGQPQRLPQARRSTCFNYAAHGAVAGCDTHQRSVLLKKCVRPVKRFF